VRKCGCCGKKPGKHFYYSNSNFNRGKQHKETAQGNSTGKQHKETQGNSTVKTKTKIFQLDFMTTTNVRTTHRRSNHLNYYKQRAAHEIIITEHVKDYRAAVEKLVRSDDLALEVGCAGGETTRCLGKIARLTYGIDKTVVQKNLNEQNKNSGPNTRFLPLDCNDIGSLIKLSKSAAEEVNGPHEGFSVILIDISGSASFKALLTLLERYEDKAVFGKSIRLIIIKSFRFANLMDRSRIFEPQKQPQLVVTKNQNKRMLPLLIAAFGFGALLGGVLIGGRR